MRGDPPASLETLLTGLLTAFCGMAQVPNWAVTPQQWMYEYVWDYYSLWALVTVSFPSYNFTFPLVSTCSEWRIWNLVSGRFFPWLSESFCAWWYRGTRNRQMIPPPCKISSSSPTVTSYHSTECTFMFSSVAATCQQHQGHSRNP